MIIRITLELKFKRNFEMLVVPAAKNYRTTQYKFPIKNVTCTGLQNKLLSWSNLYFIKTFT